MPRCRFCHDALTTVFADLGMSPLSNAYLRPEDLERMEPFFPLKVYVCGRCFLVQLPAAASPEEIFTDYAYFSSFSDTWLAHCKAFALMIIERLGLGAASQVIEIASNDGYLLRWFKDAGVPVLGIEPAANVANVAIERGIPTLVRFFGVETARELAAQGERADLLAGNNVLAHVPDLNDFVEGLRILLAEHGVITMEFPHLLRLMESNLFDTIYHEHFSYFSLLTVIDVFAAHGLTIFDVDELPTHGGSIRIYACHEADDSKAVTTAVARLVGVEERAGLRTPAGYEGFREAIHRRKRELLSFLIKAKHDGKRVAGYGAPAKGNTLLNYCGIRDDFLEFTVDRSPHKQGLFLPGTRVPIRAPEDLVRARPDYVLILPWNLRDEITEQMAVIRTWGGKFVVALPRLEVIG
jgi:hypothetical protein